MKLTAAILVWLIWITLAVAQSPPGYYYCLGVVRIKSHGASGVVIRSMGDTTYILGVSHMLHGSKWRNKKVVIDGPGQRFAPQGISRATVIAVDYRVDLCLIKLDNGPFFRVDVGRKRYQGKAYSAGYDNMKWPATFKTVNIVQESGGTIYTRERPWHGRSGGAFISQRTGKLIGIVQGYETRGSRRGVYISLKTIRRFLATYAPWKRQIGNFVMPQFVQRGLPPNC